MAPLEKKMGIRVLAVAPGIVRTPLWTASPKASMLKEKDEWVEP
jgi:3-hydroxybutyrate dehydrogenase